MTKNCLHRYEEFYKKLGVKTYWIDDELWRSYNKMIVPAGAVLNSISLDNNQKKELHKYFKSEILIRYNIQSQSTSDIWYVVLCNKFIELQQYPSKLRSEINRGFKNCKVEKVDAIYASENFFEAYCSAYQRYKASSIPMNKEQFKQHILKSKDFGDIIDFWSVKDIESGKTIAYSQNYLYEKKEVNYSTIKISPEFLKNYPAYALIYTMNKHYLEQEKFEYINDGFKNLMHQTNFQEFLIKKFGFYKHNLKMEINFKPSLNLLIKSTYYFKEKLSKLSSKLSYLYKLEQLSRESQ